VAIMIRNRYWTYSGSVDAVQRRETPIGAQEFLLPV